MRQENFKKLKYMKKQEKNRIYTETNIKRKQPQTGKLYNARAV